MNPHDRPALTTRSDFGLFLRRIRVGQRISQSLLAERAGFDHSYVSRLEAGVRTPTRDAVAALAEALGLDAAGQDALLAAAGFLPTSAGSLIVGEPELADALDLLRDESVPARTREHVREMLRLLVADARAA